MVTNISASSLAAALTAEKGIEPKKTPVPGENFDASNADLDASIAAYMSVPGFNNASPVQSDPAIPAVDNDTAIQGTSAKTTSDAEKLKLALQQFDEGLKKLVNRPETQAFQAKQLGVMQDDQPQPQSPDPLPGVDDKGQLEILSGNDLAADTNHDGKVSEEERLRYEMPLTYRSSESYRVSEARDQTAADGPSALSLAETNHAYGAAGTPAQET